jgi:MOSC domain-containing protein YiiM
MTKTATVVALCIGTPRTLGQDDAPDPFDRPWTSGIFKAPVADALWLTSTGFSGDGQADLEVHGGPDKAVCVYSADHYSYWRTTTGNESFTFGAFGENLSVEGLDEQHVCIGDVWSVGDAEVEISQPRQPCWKVARKWRRRTLTDEVVSSGHTGWYFRVRREGQVAPGAALSLLERRHPEWTIVAANRVMHRREGDTAALARLDELSASWRRTLEKRLHAAASSS